MRFESRPVQAIELVSYDILVQLQADYDKYHGGQYFIDHLFSQQRDRTHLTDVIFVAANVMEPRHPDGSLLDFEKLRSKAVVAGGLIAAAIVDRAGGGQILDNLVLHAPEDATTEVGRDKWSNELQNNAFETIDQPKYSMFRGLMLLWESQLAEPVAQSYLRVGFGIVMAATEAEIARQHGFLAMENDINQLDNPRYNFDLVFRRFLKTQQEKQD